MKEMKPFIETLMIAIIGGWLFSILNLPIPWMLGPITFVMLSQGLLKRQLFWPNRLKKLGLIILGMFFGLYFTMETMQIIGPYIIPYLIITIILILVSIVNSSLAAKYMNVDQATSVFGSIPGSLAEMVIASESLKANTAYVLIFQTIRLVIVLFTVPFLILYVFSGDSSVEQMVIAQSGLSLISWQALWLVLPITLGIRFQYILPAGLMIIPLIITAVMNISPIQVPTIPNFLFLTAQLFVGASLGISILFKDIKQAGKYGVVYAGLAIILILVSFGFGFILEALTTMDLPTALLSTAPGGIVEMVLTASMVGADPAIVTALQLMRIVIIILIVPVGLKWYFNKKIQKNAA